MEGQVTELLRRWRTGDRAARDELAPIVAAELRRRLGALEPGGDGALAPHAVVRAACSGLAGSGLAGRDRARLSSMASSALRSMLGARERARRTAGRRNALSVVLAESLDGRSRIDLLRLDDALAALGLRDRRAERVLELFYFGGLTQAEIGGLLELTAATVDRDLRFGRAWLERELERQARPAAGDNRRAGGRAG